MSSSNSSPFTLLAKDYRGSTIFVNCIVPSGQVLIQVETDVGTGIYANYQAITENKMFNFQCPAADVNVRITPSGGATVILPGI